ncbi:mitochondrial carrier [Acaromyces ingoldii]|uniref:Mitochondrial carrier n=1 Tax=Acaromyces ingoldii TaxID=215250 RepID=A0A316YSJ7_9BASI|nr:mitochondrial carrier [Acaromyces ingoldii]PWN92530.1 mitochondrial carrier [Acaromyces ingoldii]
MASPQQQAPHPLRPYYRPSEDEAFVATAPRFSASSSSASSSTPAGSSFRSSSSAAAAKASAPSSSASNRYIRPDDDLAAAAGAGTGGVKDVARALLVSGALQYSSTCLAMPFEVGKLLLQVQWVPRDDVWVAFGESSGAGAGAVAGMAREDEMQPLRRRRGRGQYGEGDEEEDEDGGYDDDDDDDVPPEAEEWREERDEEHGRARDFGGEDDELSDEEEAEAYFRDLSNTPMRRPSVQTSARRSTGARRKRTDAAGYVVRRSIHEDGTRPEFVMPVVVRGGVWEMIKAVGRGKEGWLGLWKGSLTTFVLEMATSTLQPIVTTVLSVFSPSALTPLPLPYAPHPYRSLSLLVVSHLVTGILVSPLDLVRTRLVVQSTLPPHRKYRSPWDALRQILHEEGGWRTIYLHPNLLIPTVLDFTLRPLLSLSAPILIEHKLRIDPNTSPVAYALADFVLSTLALVFTLPIETVRRRLQIQARAPWGMKPDKIHGSRPAVPHTRSSSSSVPKVKNGSSAATALASATGAAPLPALSRPLRTCVETRPRPYIGVTEAIYRILTEETSTTPVPRDPAARRRREQQRASRSNNDADEDDDDDLAKSGILAKHGHSSLGGLYSLYRGFGFAVGANALVFALTLVSGERQGQSTGWAEI